MKLTKLLGVSSACLLCACSSDELSEQIPASTTTSATEQIITVTTAELDAPLTRIAATAKPGGGYTFPWQDGDQIAVYGSSSEAKGWGFFTLVSGSGEATGNFKGIFKLQPEVEYYSFYPALDLKSGTNATAVPVDYTGQKQTADASLAHLDNYIYMTAKGDADYNFNSKHVGSLVKIQLTDANYKNITKIVLSLPEGGSFVQKGTIDLTSTTSTAAPSITSSLTATTFEMEYSAGSATLSDNTITAYAMMAPTDLTGKPILAEVMHTNGISVYYDLSSDKEDTFVAGKAYTLTGSNNSEYVDLGLPDGTLWATCNIGASRPDQYGYYFAWGEVAPKETYSWENYKFGTSHALSKYCTSSADGTVDGKTRLEAEDDAAYVNWGPDWCMPTSQQMKDLFSGEYTTKEWTSQNGVYGLKITSKTYTDRSIFLPAGGYETESGVEDSGVGRYWSSTMIPEKNSYLARYAHFDNGHYEFIDIARRIGQSIRPVRRVSVEKEYVDLGLPSGTLWAKCNIGASRPEEAGYYFAWGEVTQKASYTWENYKFGTSHALSKYCSQSADGTVDGKTLLEAEDDAATVSWGSDWCMPTTQQMNELFNDAYTTHEWTKFNGINGMKITSKTHPDRFIFLPAGGYKRDSETKDVGEYGRYWSSTMKSSVDSYLAGYLLFDTNNVAAYLISRCWGYPVRAVKKQQ